MTPPCPLSQREAITVVVLTHQRRAEVLATVARLVALPERPPVVVVDNGSRDGTAAALAARFPTPQVRVLSLPRNLGAAARNAGVAATRTPYVAFCDDDCWWAPGSLARAVALLDTHTDVAVLSASIRIGPAARADPTCARMAASPLRSAGLPGRAVVGFMAGACVMRREAFTEAGGYEPRLFLGGEEQLLSLDLLARGWRLVYCDELLVHHHPSAQRDVPGRRLLLLRNALWVAWLRRPWRSAWRETRRLLQAARAQGQLLGTLAAAARGLPWALARRRAVPRHVDTLQHVVDHAEHAEAGEAAEAGARRPAPASATGRHRA